jgi:hypothetical protein
MRGFWSSTHRYACLLLVGYLLYVRDGLAKLMFADMSNPRSDPDPYYWMSTAESVRRALRPLLTTFLALLPALLLGVSFFCLMARLGQLVDIAAAIANGPAPAVEEVGLARADPPPAPAARPSQESPHGRAGSDAPDTTGASGQLTGPVTLPPDRERVLLGATIDGIPLLTS